MSDHSFPVAPAGASHVKDSVPAATVKTTRKLILYSFHYTLLPMFSATAASVFARMGAPFRSMSRLKPLLPPIPDPKAVTPGPSSIRKSFAQLRQQCEVVITSRKRPKSPDAAPAVPSGAAPTPKPASEPLSRTKIELSPKHDYFVGYPVLDSVGVIFHTALKLIKCMHCDAYLPTEHIKGHMHGKHDVTLAQTDLANAVTLLDSLKAHRTAATVVHPAPLGPPVQGLETVSGYACEEPDCHYACVDADTITRHQRVVHKRPYAGTSRPKRSLQSIFHNPAKFFTVNPALHTCADPDFIGALSAHFIPEATKPPPVLTPQRDSDTSPFHQVMAFDDLLVPFRHSRPNLDLLVSLRARHTKEEAGGIYERLARIASVWSRMVPSMMKGHTVSLDLARVLLYGRGAIPPKRYVSFFIQRLLR